MAAGDAMRWRRFWIALAAIVSVVVTGTALTRTQYQMMTPGERVAYVAGVQAVMATASGGSLRTQVAREAFIDGVQDALIALIEARRMPWGWELIERGARAVADRPTTAWADEIGRRRIEPDLPSLIVGEVKLEGTE